MNQKHLSYEEITNRGSFYTPAKYVKTLFEMLKKEEPNLSDWTILDNSCGYGSFFDFGGEFLASGRTVGADIDKKALDTASKRNPNVEYFFKNALAEIVREKYRITDTEKLVIVGNPPYNDVTSKVKNGIKSGFFCDIDDSVITRDLGISFMLSYEKLSPDYVCVLHPLSYLIKRANYQLLSPFLSKYRLKSSIIINSQEFSQTSKETGFPIILAVYKRAPGGTSYKEIMSMDYRLSNGQKFNLKFDTIANHIRKYPIKGKQYDGESPLFWTMRDINALKRSRSFVVDFSPNAIIVDVRKLSYYCYVDVFKDNIAHVPFYLGNCDVMIDDRAFSEIESHFIAKSVEKHRYLNKYFTGRQLQYDKKIIDNYFVQLLGGNYVH